MDTPRYQPRAIESLRWRILIISALLLCSIALLHHFIGDRLDALGERIERERTARELIELAQKTRVAAHAHRLDETPATARKAMESIEALLSLAEQAEPSIRKTENRRRLAQVVTHGRRYHEALAAEFGGEVASAPSRLTALQVEAMTALGTAARELEEDQRKEWRAIRASFQQQLSLSLLFLAAAVTGGAVYLTTAHLNRAIDLLHAQNRELEEAKRDADEASRAKGSFVAHMSHEIRTPLNAVLGTGELLWDTSLDETQRRYVRVCRSSGEALLRVINDVLDFSKLEAGGMILAHEEFEPRALVASAREMIELRAHAKRLTLEVRIDPEVPTRLVGDPDRLRQVLLNLLANAVKFTDQGSIGLEVKLEHLTDGEARLGFTVHDTGIGISADQRGRLFQSFSQVDDSLSRRHGGTGLGLAISQSLVGMMGGEIRVESESGQGSRFSFTAHFDLGATEPPAPIATLPAAEVPPRRALKILAAEDADDNRFLLQAMLKKSPHTLEFAVDGHEALERFRTGRYDLILMDMQMPVMDGYAATREIRTLERDRGLGHTPIVAFTASAMAEDAATSVRAGCDGHLGKPVTKKALLEAIDAYAG